MALSKVDLANMVENVAPSSTIPDVNFRNIIINGDMSIAQRATSTASITTEAYHTIDRYATFITTLGTWTQSQSTDVPTGQGFAKSLKMDCTTADASPAAGDRLLIQQKIEGQNLQYIKKGTSSAESLTLSFWVKSNKTGTYIAELFDNDNTRQISQSYTISSADTWEKKTMTFAGDTSGVLGNDNGDSLILHLWLGAGTTYSSGTLSTTWTSNTNANRAVGQVNLADSTSNEWYVTGVQLEAGTSASDFEFLPFDINLQRCERYFYQAGTSVNGAGEQNIGIGQWYSASEIVYNIYAPTTMRTKPSLTTPTVTNGYRFHKSSSYVESDTAGSISDAGNQILAVYKSGLSGGTGGQASFVVTKSSPAKVQFSAEL
jgi:hypothetical protein